MIWTRSAEFSKRTPSSPCFHRRGWMVVLYLNNLQNPPSWPEIFWPFINLSFVSLPITESVFTSKRMRGAVLRGQVGPLTGAGRRLMCVAYQCGIGVCLSPCLCQSFGSPSASWGLWLEGGDSLEEMEGCKLGKPFAFFLLELWVTFLGVLCYR